MNFIDVSSFQTIAEIEAAYAKLDFGGIIIKLSQGTSYVNPLYSDQIAWGESKGLEIAFYHYLDAFTQPELAHALAVYNGAKAQLGHEPAFYAWDIETIRAVDSIPNLASARDQFKAGHGEPVYAYTDQSLASAVAAKTGLPLWLAAWLPSQQIEKVVDTFDDKGDDVAIVQDTNNVDNLHIDGDETAPAVDTDAAPSSGAEGSPSPATPAPEPSPADVVSPLENPNANQIDYAPGRVSIRWDTDADGNGWAFIDTPAEDIVSIIAQGPYPPDNGYWRIPTFGIQVRELNGIEGTLVSFTGGPTNSNIEIWVLLR